MYNKTHILVLLMILTTGCESGRNDNSDSDDDAGTSQDAGSSDADADADYEIDYSCGDDCPQDMVEVPGMCACIDSYEYSIESFAEFLNDRGNNDCDGFLCMRMEIEGTYITNLYEMVHEGEPLEYIRDEAIKEIDGGTFQLTNGLENFPVGLVTWYGADRACRWEGKRLCPQDVWYAVCSRGGEYHYPYGGTTGGVGSEGGFYEDYIPDNCNTGGGYSTAKVGTFVDCEGGYPGIFDMAGNIEEWVEVTEDGKYMRLGGHYSTNTAEDGEPDNGAGCVFNGLNIISEDGDIPSNKDGSSSGFRCCVMGNP